MADAGCCISTGIPIALEGGGLCLEAEKNEARKISENAAESPASSAAEIKLGRVLYCGDVYFIQDFISIHVIPDAASLMLIQAGVHPGICSAGI
jgi:hypothetical protein